jgi:hypothetical protein
MAAMTPPLDDVPPAALFTQESQGIVSAPPDRVWRVIESIGADLGWYAWPVGWVARGLADHLFGGPGVRLTRPERANLQPGDVVDWWVVEAVEQGGLLRLRAQTRLPGVAWLDLAVGSGPYDETSVLRLTTSFLPQGLAGRLYWLSILPAHGVVFGGLRRQISRRASRLSWSPSS